MIFWENEKSAQEKADQAESWSGYAILLILGGIVLEIFLLFVFPPQQSNWELWWLVLANVLIGAGLAIEFGCILQAIKSNRELKTESDAELREALDRASKAEEGLIRFRTPRRKIMEGKWEFLCKKIMPFKGTSFDAGVCDGSEPMHFWWDFAHALTAAGWSHMAWTDMSGIYKVQGPLPRSGSVPGMNVEIHIHKESRAVLEPAALALIATLRENGIDAEDAGFNVHSVNTRAIHIVIGDKW